jgi:hypothetical protein
MIQTRMRLSETWSSTTQPDRGFLKGIICSEGSATVRKTPSGDGLRIMSRRRGSVEFGVSGIPIQSLADLLHTMYRRAFPNPQLLFHSYGHSFQHYIAVSMEQNSNPIVSSKVSKKQKKQKKQKRQQRYQRGRTLIGKACEASSLCNADIFLGIKFRETNQIKNVLFGQDRCLVFMYITSGMVLQSL